MVKLKSPLRKFNTIRSWLSVSEYPFHRRYRICYLCRDNNPVPFPRIRSTELDYLFVITWATWREPHVEHWGSADPSRAPEITPSFWWSSCCLAFSFLCRILCTIIGLFVFLFFSHGVVSLFSIYEFEYPSGIFRPSFQNF